MNDADKHCLQLNGLQQPQGSCDLHSTALTRRKNCSITSSFTRDAEMEMIG